MRPTPTWRKSSHSDETGGACVELAQLSGAIGVRDSKAPDAGHLVLPRQGFATLAQVLRHELPHHASRTHTTTQWRKSARSEDHGNCVELARLVGGVGVRVSTDADAGHLILTRRAFASLTAQAKRD
ncbi:DUF397 domain-containing protein [Actinomadura geliboluensis]